MVARESQLARIARLHAEGAVSDGRRRILRLGAFAFAVEEGGEATAAGRLVATAPAIHRSPRARLDLVDEAVHRASYTGAIARLVLAGGLVAGE